MMGMVEPPKSPELEATAAEMAETVVKAAEETISSATMLGATERVTDCTGAAQRQARNSS